MSILLNDEKSKRISVFKQRTSQLQTTRNLMIIISSINNNQRYIILSTLTTSNDDFSSSVFFIFISVSDNIFASSAKTIFSSNNDASTSIFVDELIIDSILQKTRLFNATNVESKQQRAFNHHSKFRSVKDFSMNLLIDFAILFNCDSAVIKVVLILFVKIASVDFYESKSYKKQ